ncbi:sucrose-specific PTS transporter subunit IIBC [Ligilactobacillus agilis]|nr:sucrose-specific PTS transporter subunit IIBC [Ligilactobacillus agilis]MBL1055412.1 PTS beta-glucoside transporter subunit IIBCA [Ligilactobacillus agilis]MCI5761961.1 sucrose-specific PTS transporter subunit IIBC [Ligilactobacillus agilis]MDK6809682.1 sucrose-specific PTS transporter subunit IIBC [Ligilactobacillus agilis]NJE32177.1 PTS beta-glucoside transporter subunit IIBCA [Ligilactobacillus agilis]NME41177.1 PTS beta-glucoside transporter subunit IIBCA [Ligilactobacillus agilis]
MDYKKVASQVIEAVGRDNMVAAAHCATRLRLVLKDDQKIDQAALDNNADVKGTFKTNGQYQIIIGPGDVNFVYDELIKQTGLSEASTEDLKQIAAGNQKFNPVMAFIKLLSDIFVPIIPALVAGGLLMALNNFLTSAGLFGPKALVETYPAIKGLSSMIQVMSAAPFIFMPVLVGISAAKRFGANQFLGAAVGMIMTTPGLIEGKYWNIFGLHVSQTNYYYQVIPVLAAVYILSVLEKWLHKKLPDAVDFTFTPLISLMVTGFLTFVIVGPVMRGLSDAITNGIVWLYDTLGFVGTGVFGLLYSPIVLTGLHQAFPAIETQLITAFTQNHTGYGDFIFVVASMANVAQGAACFAVFMLTKNKKMKGLSSSATVSALLGITEPALFGVNLKLRFPFFCALIGSGIASAIAGLTHVIAVSLGSAAFLGFLSINAKSIPLYVMCELISFAVAFALTFFYGKTHADLVNPEVAATAASAAQASATSSQVEAASEMVADVADVDNENIAAPVDGQVKDLGDVNDQVFSTKLMGDGAAIVPSDGTVYSPVDGQVTVAYETKHAYGLKSKDGAEVLIHIGIDTVNLKGEGFESFVKQGQTVKAGDKLGTVDLAKVKAEGYDTTVMVVVTNTNNYASVNRLNVTDVKHGDNVVAVTTK